METASDREIALPTIAKVLSGFLAEQQKRLSAKSFSRYRLVIGLLTDSLNNYAYQALSESDAELFNRLYNAEGNEHREFCEIFGPDLILPNIGEFLGYFMIRKVLAGAELKRAAGTVTKTLARWLAEKGYVSEQEAAEGAAEGEQAARDLPRAEALARQLMEYTERHGQGAEDDEGAVEDHFTIKRVEPGRIWLEGMDGSELGPIALPPALARQCKVGWAIAGAVGQVRGRWKLLEVWNVYPE
jgi:hypothetical protein